MPAIASPSMIPAPRFGESYRLRLERADSKASGAIPEQEIWEVRKAIGKLLDNDSAYRTDSLVVHAEDHPEISGLTPRQVYLLTRGPEKDSLREYWLKIMLAPAGEPKKSAETGTSGISRLKAMFLALLPSSQPKTAPSEPPAESAVEIGMRIQNMVKANMAKAFAQNIITPTDPEVPVPYTQTSDGKITLTQPEALLQLLP